MSRSVYSIFFVLLAALCFSQEGLRPLRANINCIYKDLKPEVVKRATDVSQQRTSAVTLQIPFAEDFYYAPTNSYPDQNKWSDSTVYVNSGFPIAAPSIGVATFDGLNKHGYPYNPTLTNLTVSRPADTLTSRPINLYTAGSTTLDPSANVAISFYYQARGRGDTPELTDSLILDFFRPYATPTGTAQPDTAWKRVWYVSGNTNSNTNDTAFKRAFVRITDTAYFHDGFKFRFRNWASPTGDFDHWHLDYIFLDKGRGDSLFDTVRNDITIGEIPTPFLKDYSSMPYRQYATSEMDAKNSVKIRNNSAQQVNMSYKRRIFNETHTQVSNEYNGGFDNLNPFWKNTYQPPGNGYSRVKAHSNPPVDTFLLPSPPQRVMYEIKHFVFLNGSAPTNPSDVFKDNDTVRQFQSFNNYYAFDDGSAEAGYYVNTNGAKMAVKIKLNTADTLNSLRIYFDPVGDLGTISSPSSVHVFTIHVWSVGSDGAPANILYKDDLKRIPEYLNSGFKESAEFKLTRPFVMNAGSYFIGFQQANIVTVGFDRNYNHQTSLYFDSGTGWTQSTEYGSVMIRPVFSDLLKGVVGINESSLSPGKLFRVFPNPVSDQLTIVSQAPGHKSYRFFNSLGELVTQGKTEGMEHVVSTSGLAQGMYILVLENEEGIQQQQKIIVQR